MRFEAGDFPSGFAWGVATSSHQIEGGAEARGVSIWDAFATSATVHHGDDGDIACDHYHRWREDLDLLAELGVPWYRLSLSWPRLQPGGVGRLEPDGVAFYRGLLEGLHERGIEPFVTLYHWDLPQPLEVAGGWPARATAERFAEYVTQVVAELGTLSRYWVTVNEPWCAAFLGYGYGAHAPGRRDLSAAVAAAHHLNLAHGLAVGRIRACDPSLQVGVTNLVTDVRPKSQRDVDVAAAGRLDAAHNRFFLEPYYLGNYSDDVHALFDRYGLAAAVRDGDLDTIAAPTDFAGVNHYQRVIVADDPTSGHHLDLSQQPASPATTSLGWSVVPGALTDVLVRVAREFTSLPLWVTENGAAFDDYADPTGQVRDPERVEYLDHYIAAVGAARRLGVDVRGYFAWSFLDNFEWAEGYSKRFGLVFVDFATQTRTPKLSARWFSRLIAEHRRTYPLSARLTAG